MKIKLLSRQMIYEIKKNIVGQFISAYVDEKIQEFSNDEIITEIHNAVMGLDILNNAETTKIEYTPLTANEGEEFEIVVIHILNEYMKRRKKLMRENKKKLISRLLKLKNINKQRYSEADKQSTEKNKLYLIDEIFRMELERDK